MIHHNVFRDQQTNGDLVATDTHGNIQNNIAFYDNIDYYSAGGDSTSCRHNDGDIGCFGTSVCTNFSVFNNTLSYPGARGWNISGGPGTMTVEDNLFYGCSYFVMVGGTNVVDYNSYLNSGQSAVGSHDVSSSSAPDPFVNLSAGNLNLASENADWSGRLSLSAPWTSSGARTPRIAAQRSRVECRPRFRNLLPVCRRR